MIAIGALCVGDPLPAAGAPAAASGAIATLEKGVTGLQDIQKLVNTKTMKNLKDGVDATLKLYNSIDFSQLKKLNKVNTDVPMGGDGASNKDAVTTVEQIASWDDWSADVDAQMQYAVTAGVPGANPYKIGLQKYNIDGKLVSQCRAEVNRAAFEYVERALAVRVATRDLDRLTNLLADYKGEAEDAAIAKEAFYDRKMSAITSVLIEMRKAKWAYKYAALEESGVDLSPMKTISDYNRDAYTLQGQLETWLEKLSHGFSRKHFNLRDRVHS